MITFSASRRSCVPTGARTAGRNLPRPRWFETSCFGKDARRAAVRLSVVANPPRRSRLVRACSGRYDPLITDHTRETLPDFPKELSCLSEQASRLGASLKRLCCVRAVLKRIFVAAWCSRSLCPAMHAATLFAMYCRRSAQRIRTGPRSAAGAAKHRTRVSLVCA
jgi:hypothetical protein